MHEAWLVLLPRLESLALAELADADREVLLMRGIEQLPTDEVAKQLGLGRDAVSKR